MTSLVTARAAYPSTSAMSLPSTTSVSRSNKAKSLA